MSPASLRVHRPTMNYLANAESARLLCGVLGLLSVLSFVATKLAEVLGRTP